MPRRSLPRLRKKNRKNRPINRRKTGAPVACREQRCKKTGAAAPGNATARTKFIVCRRAGTLRIPQSRHKGLRGQSSLYAERRGTLPFPARFFLERGGCPPDFLEIPFPSRVFWGAATVRLIFLGDSVSLPYFLGRGGFTPAGNHFLPKQAALPHSGERGDTYFY